MIRTKLGLLLVVVAAACKPSSTASPSVVKIGADLDRTGSIATPSWMDSILLAATTVNQALKQTGHPQWRFEIVEANSGNAPEQASAAALQLVQKDGVKAIITDSSQDDIAVNMLSYDGAVQHDLGVPVVCMACTSPNINNPAATDANPVKQAALRNLKGWNFRTTMSDAYQARVVARLLSARGQGGDVNGDGRFKVSIYASDDPYGHGFSDVLKKLLIGHRADAEVEQVFHDARPNTGEYDWAADVARLVDRKNESTGRVTGIPDVVVEITFPKFIVGFMRAWTDKAPILHTHNFRSMRLLETLNLSMEGQEGTSQAVLADGASAQAFAEDLKSQTGQLPAFRDSAAYDAAMTLMLATVHASKAASLADPAQVSGARLRDSLRAINDKAGEPVYAGVAGIANAIRLVLAGKAIDYVGASGPCDYDANGDIVAQLARFKVQGNQFLDVQKFECVRGGDCSPITAIGAR